MIIVIDAGHGGNDPGAVGENLQEKKPALDIALMAKEMLEEAGFTVILTRLNDYFVELQERADIANDAGADIFVSIHHNGFSDRQANGIETLFHPNSVNGRKLANEIQTKLAWKLDRSDRGIKGRQDLYVLNKTAMPAVLTEIGFVTNPEEQELLKTCTFKFKAARAITQGIIKYFREVN